MFPPGAVLSAVTVTFCPSLNIGSREGAIGAVGLIAGWGGETAAGVPGVTEAAGAGSETDGVEAMLPGNRLYSW